MYAGASSRYTYIKEYQIHPPHPDRSFRYRFPVKDKMFAPPSSTLVFTVQRQFFSKLNEYIFYHLSVFYFIFLRLPSPSLIIFPWVFTSTLCKSIGTLTCWIVLTQVFGTIWNVLYFRTDSDRIARQFNGRHVHNKISVSLTLRKNRICNIICTDVWKHTRTYITNQHAESIIVYDI